MSLPAVAGNTIQASDMYQLCQPSGGQETGHYYNAGWASASPDKIAEYVYSQSRNATPLSATVDTSDLAPTGVGTPTTSHLTNGGFAIECNATGSGSNIGCGGKYTIQY